MAGPDTEHVSDEALADYSAGSSEPAAAQTIRTHLAGCVDCTHRMTTLSQVSLVLAGQPSPAMPADVFDRLHRTVDGLGRATGAGDPRLPPTGQNTSGQNTSGQNVPATRHPQGWSRPTLGALDEHIARRARRTGRLLLGTLGALALAALVGFGGYVLSAASGSNEPSPNDPLVVSGTAIGPAVSAEPGVESLSAHRFSSAWNCARKATDGRITGIQTSIVDGTRGLMVYLDGPGDTIRAVFVSGCDSDRPSAGPSTTLPRR